MAGLQRATERRESRPDIDRADVEARTAGLGSLEMGRPRSVLFAARRASRACGVARKAAARRVVTSHARRAGSAGAARRGCIAELGALRAAVAASMPAPANGLDAADDLAADNLLDTHAAQRTVWLSQTRSVSGAAPKISVSCKAAGGWFRFRDCSGASTGNKAHVDDYWGSPEVVRASATLTGTMTSCAAGPEVAFRYRAARYPAKGVTRWQYWGAPEEPLWGSLRSVGGNRRGTKPTRGVTV